MLSWKRIQVTVLNSDLYTLSGTPLSLKVNFMINFLSLPLIVFRPSYPFTHQPQTSTASHRNDPEFTALVGAICICSDALLSLDLWLYHSTFVLAPGPLHLLFVFSMSNV